MWPLSFAKISFFQRAGNGNSHGKPTGEPWDYTKSKAGEYTLKDGALLVRMMSHKPHFCLYVYDANGGWEQYSVIFNWWPRRKEYYRGHWMKRIGGKKGKM